MRTFTYTIKDSLGIHARPAGQLVKTAQKFSSTISVEKNGKKADATRLIALMGMGIKCGDALNITIEGDDEDKAYEEIKSFLEENL